MKPSHAMTRAMIGMVCLTALGGAPAARARQSDALGTPPEPGQKKAALALVTGTVTYRQRSALPPNAVLRVRLEDVSRQDAAAGLIAEVTLPTGGRQVPLAFSLPYRVTDIVASHRYHVRATLFVKDQMLFTTTQAYPALTGGAPSRVALVVQAVQAVPPSVASPVRAPAGSSAPFVDTVWKVRTSRQVASGQLYVFLSGGALVVASPNGKPALGSWTYKNGILTLTEEGQRYTAGIVTLTPREFRIKIHNPGSPVEMTLVPAHATSGR